MISPRRGIMDCKGCFMKHTIKIIGVIAMVVVGFSFITCSDGSGGGGGETTYQIIKIVLSSANFNTKFGPGNVYGTFVGHETPSTTDVKFITGNRPQLILAIDSTVDLRIGFNSATDEFYSVTISQIRAMAEGEFSSANVNAIINTLTSAGYCVAYISNGINVVIYAGLKN